MPKFIVKERSFINNHIVEAGTEIEYEPGSKGEVAENLEPAESPQARENPGDTELKGPFTLGAAAGGWVPVLDADGKKVKSLRVADADAFGTLSDEDKLAYLAG